MLRLPFTTCILFISLSFHVAVSTKPKHLRGISPADLTYYTSSSTIKCRDGSKVLEADRINDDFCDCLDGSDEPGTSACPNSSFYCRNRGHVPLVIFSSRVNDGICDCCDGSDEYEGRAACPNTCKEAGSAARQRLSEEVARYREGVKLRAGATVDWATKKDKWTAEKTELEEKKHALEEEEKVLKAKKEAVEAREREEKEWRERLEKEQASREKVEQEGRPPPPPVPAADEHAQAAAGEPGAGSGGDGQAVVSGGEVEGTPGQPSEQPPSGSSAAEGDNEDLSNLSKEEMGRRIASRWTGGGGGGGGRHEAEAHGGGEHNAEQEQIDDVAHGGEEEEPVPEGDDYNPDDFEGDGIDHEDGDHDDHDEFDHADVPEDYEDDGDWDEQERELIREERRRQREEDERKRREEEERKQKANDDDDDDATGEEEVDLNDPPATTPVTTWFARVLHWPQQFCSNLYSLIARPPALNLNHTEAAAVKSEYSRVSTEVGKMRTRIRTLSDKLKHDYGPNGEFISMADRCFSFHVNQYEYEVCPWKKVTQKEGHSTTTVGRWKGFGENYSVLKFEDGDHCWNGPARSMKVVLLCGVKQEMLSVEEPNRCEYLATMTTPALCTEQRAKELEKELQEREADLAVHDEL